LGNEADFHAGEIRKSGRRIKLQDQPFRVLQILLERRGELVTREELQSLIWPEDSFGDFDHAVNVAVGKLRAALGDSAENPSFIETVPRRGDRFVASLDEGPVDTHSAATRAQRRSAQESGIGIQPHAPGISRSRDLRDLARPYAGTPVSICENDLVVGAKTLILALCRPFLPSCKSLPRGE
jgi:DNA-binding winged helix-turn-helix (wHTH) protein